MMKTRKRKTAIPVNKLGLVTYLTDDYDRAIDWFSRCLGFRLVEDTPQPGKRWVVMAPHPGAETAFLIARATSDQVRGIGQAGAGRVAYFLETDDFAAKHQAMRRAGVVFEEPARHEPYGTVAVFRDLHGNRWDLLQRK